MDENKNEPSNVEGFPNIFRGDTGNTGPVIQRAGDSGDTLDFLKKVGVSILICIISLIILFAHRHNIT